MVFLKPLLFSFQLSNQSVTSATSLYLNAMFWQFLLLLVASGFEPLNLGSLVDCSTPCAITVMTKYRSITIFKPLLFPFQMEQEQNEAH